MFDPEKFVHSFVWHGWQPIAHRRPPSMTGGRGAVVLRADLFVFSPVCESTARHDHSVTELTNSGTSLYGEQQNSFADTHRYMGLAL